MGMPRGYFRVFTYKNKTKYLRLITVIRDDIILYKSWLVLYFNDLLVLFGWDQVVDVGVGRLWILKSFLMT